MDERLLASIIVVAIMLLVGLPVHEFSHALAAYRLGDSTARFQGRLTLNPIAHFDPIGGTLLAVTFLLGLFNLIPIPPLDGGAIMLSLVPPRTAWQLRPVLAQYGFFLIILLIIPLGGSSVLGRFLLPIVDSIYGVLVG